MEWLPRIIRMKVHHIDNKAEPFTTIPDWHKLRDTSEIVERGDITTEEPVRRFW